MSVLIVATSHIASESIKEVEETILKEKPECVAVELDKLRYENLKIEGETSNTEMLKHLGASTFLVVWIFKKLQQWLGSKVGILPGSEMMKAVEIAKKNNIRIALIDQDIGATLNGIKNIPRGEKFKLVWYLIKAPVMIKFSSKSKDAVTIDLSKAPSDQLVDQAIEMLKQEFPILYQILVDDRNKFMAEKIRELEKHFQKIVVVVGAGHKKGLGMSLEKSI